jgi:DNA-binding NarL/FixJ family response regulator
MNIIFFASNIDIVDECVKRHSLKNTHLCYDIESLNMELIRDENSIVIADYDSVANDINKLLSSNKIPKKMIVIEYSPEIATGKMLVSKGVKAYGNSRMLTQHFYQMTETVEDGKIWTYPELTMAMSTLEKNTKLNENSWNILVNRLTQKEIEVVDHILNGLTNDAISEEMQITTRTVKAHISSIFSKLHVNDRLGLVLLLK